jgi:outer membrane lipoprotein-sorting protein
MRNHTIGVSLVTLLLVTGVQAAGQTDTKAADVMAAAQKAIGDKKLARMKTFSAEAKLQRNVGTFQMNSDVELVLELPDKYARTDVSTGPMASERTTGFNGDQSITSTTGMTMAGGGAMVIRMGPGGPMPSAEKPTPEQQEQMKKMALRGARVEVSRLMLGWFGMAHPSINAEYTYAGQAESPDGKADLIDVKGADGFAARLFIDQQTHLPLVLSYQGPQPRIVTNGVPAGGGATTSTTHPPQGRPLSDDERKKAADDQASRVGDMQRQPAAMIEFKLFFSEWSDVDGIKFPLKIQRSTASTPDEEWTFSKVKVNPKVDPKKFQAKS